MFHDQGGCCHSLRKSRGEKKITLWQWGLSCEQSPEAVCKIPGSSSSHHSDLAGTEQRLWVGLELWSQPRAALGVANTPGKNLLCSPRPAQAQWQLLWQQSYLKALNWGAQCGCKSTSPSTGVQRSLEMKTKKALMYFKPDCHSESLGFLFTSLSSLILQPAQKGKQVPWNKPASNSWTKKIIKPTCGFGSPDSYHNSVKVVPCPQF